MTLRIIAEQCYATVSFMLSVIYAECNIKAPYTECLYAECRYAECRGAILQAKKISIKN